jgi:hypothetical protein
MPNDNRSEWEAQDELLEAWGSVSESDDMESLMGGDRRTRSQKDRLDLLMKHMSPAILVWRMVELLRDQACLI